jgi:hypothetical protein
MTNTETCGMCGREIGIIEVAYVLDGSVACEECHAKKRAEIKPAVPPATAVRLHRPSRVVAWEDDRGDMVIFAFAFLSFAGAVLNILARLFAMMAAGSEAFATSQLRLYVAGAECAALVMVGLLFMIAGYVRRISIQNDNR